MSFETPINLPKENLREWCAKNPIGEKALLYGYQNVLPNMGDILLDDMRVIQNNHLINEGFEKNPIYFIGLQVPPESSRMEITSIFVFPHFRRQRKGFNLIKSIQLQIGRQAYIQLAVEAIKVAELDPFYKGLGFTLIEGDFLDSSGVKFINYVWSERRIETKRAPDGLVMVNALEW